MYRASTERWIPPHVSVRRYVRYITHLVPCVRAAPCVCPPAGFRSVKWGVGYAMGHRHLGSWGYAPAAGRQVFFGVWGYAQTGLVPCRYTTAPSVVACPADGVACPATPDAAGQRGLNFSSAKSLQKSRCAHQSGGR
jgi:hypothetical protein